MGRLVPLVADKSLLISEGAAKGIAASIKGSIAAGRATIDAEIKALENACDWAVDSSNHWARQYREQAAKVAEQDQKIAGLETALTARANRITNMQKDIDRLEAEVERMRPIVEKAERRKALAMKNLLQNKGKGQ